MVRSVTLVLEDGGTTLRGELSERRENPSQLVPCLLAERGELSEVDRAEVVVERVDEDSEGGFLVELGGAALEYQEAAVVCASARSASRRLLPIPGSPLISSTPDPGPSEESNRSVASTSGRRPISPVPVTTVGLWSPCGSFIPPGAETR